MRIFVALFALLVIGCAYTRYRDGSVEITQLAPKGQGMGYVGEMEGVDGKPGTPRDFHTGPVPKSKDDLASDRANTLMILGVIVALVGVGLWVARIYMPLIPTTAGTYGVLAGGGMVAASFMLPTVPAWAWLVVLGVGLALILPGVWANWKTLHAEPSPLPEPEAKP